MRSTMILKVMEHMLLASLVLRNMGLHHLPISSASKLLDEVVISVTYMRYGIIMTRSSFTTPSILTCLIGSRGRDS